MRLLAAATAPWRPSPFPRAASSSSPRPGRRSCSTAPRSQQLVAFWKALPHALPAILDGEGQPTAADVEFAFVDGKLFLLQIRPFNESARARGNAYLRQLDQGRARASPHGVHRPR